MGHHIFKNFVLLIIYRIYSYPICWTTMIEFLLFDINYCNIQTRRFEKFSPGGPLLAHTTQSDRCAGGALTGPCRYATYCTNEVAPMRDAKVDAPTNPAQHRRSAERGAAYHRQVQRYLVSAKISLIRNSPIND